MMFSLNLGVGGLFLACSSGQSPYYVQLRKKIYLKYCLLVGKQMSQVLKGRREHGNIHLYWDAWSEVVHSDIFNLI